MIQSKKVWHACRCLRGIFSEWRVSCSASANHGCSYRGGISRTASPSSNCWSSSPSSPSSSAFFCPPCRRCARPPPARSAATTSSSWASPFKTTPSIGNGQLPPLVSPQTSPTTYNGTILFTLLPYVEQKGLFDQRMAANPANTFGGPNNGISPAPRQNLLLPLRLHRQQWGGLVRLRGVQLRGQLPGIRHPRHRTRASRPSTISGSMPDGTSNTVAFAEHLSVGYVSGGPCLGVWDAWSTTSQGFMAQLTPITDPGSA